MLDHSGNRFRGACDGRIDNDRIAGLLPHLSEVSATLIPDNANDATLSQGYHSIDY